MSIFVEVTKVEGPPVKPVPKPAPRKPAAPHHDRTLLPYVTVYGITLAIDSFNCTRPAYGSVGSFRFTTTREAAKIAGVNFYQMGQQAYGKSSFKQIPVDIYMEDEYGKHHLFGGELDEVTVDYDTDTITVTGRDWAGLLVDVKSPITFSKDVEFNTPGKLGASGPQSTGGCPPGGNTAPTGAPSLGGPKAPGTGGLNIQNKTPSQLAYYIATHNGFKPVVWAYPDEVHVGPTIGALAVSAGVPRTLWEQLQFFARLLGFVCFVTPGRELYFGPLPEYPEITLDWEQGELKSAPYPINNFSISYNPRRNMNFLVVVASYNVATAQQSVSAIGVATPDTANAILLAAPQVSIESNKWVVATQGAAAPDKLAALFTNLGKPVYLFHKNGLVPATAQLYAYEKALDIAKRELLTSFRMDGVGSFQPLQTFNFKGDLGDFSGQRFYANSIEHEFTMNDGWYTHVHGWTLSPITPGLDSVTAPTINGQMVAEQKAYLMHSENS